MKRLFDIMASGLGLVVLSPLFLILAIWIKLDSKGPVFYRQVRVGRNNKDFRIFKFRSMRVGADKGSLVTIGGRDPRVTRSGYWIRKFKLDELPQLINVFVGGYVSCGASSGGAALRGLLDARADACARCSSWNHRSCFH